jgi:glyoxylase-like metal-dependent hydrolase (beta-lactamase superfamily II)
LSDTHAHAGPETNGHRITEHHLAHLHPGTIYTKGLHEVGDGCFAWLEPDGSWGWSNAGLIAGDGASVLVDTLFDVPLTRNMLEGMAKVTTTKPISTVFNTHSNGDHWFGNQLLADREIIASAAAAAEMPDAGPERLVALCGLPGATGDFAREIFGPFDWSDCTPTPANRTFSGRLDLTVGGVDVQLFELGPAHTAGDTVAWVPSTKTLYAGDLLFIGGTPIIWAGPLSHWVEACDFMLGLEPEYVVPGHGPVTDAGGIRAVRDYLTYVDAEARKAYEEGKSAEQAIESFDLGDFGVLAEHGRIAQNVLSVYYELDASTRRRDVLEVFTEIARLEGFKD